MESHPLPHPEPQPGLGQCGCDRDLFLRVWRRVMPEDTPACPITVSPAEPSAASPASGGAARANAAQMQDPGGVQDAALVQEFLAQEVAAWHLYRALSRRRPGGSRTLSALGEGCRVRARRLSAALFLLSRIRFWPAGQGVPGRISYQGALREQFLAEQRRESAYRTAAQTTQDLSLHQLFLELAQDCARHSRRIRSVLEQLAE